MKTKLLLLNLATLTALAMVVLRGGNGPLLPPGPPVDGTYKTLQQIEPRTDLATVPGDSSAMHVIDQPGSYYLSGNLDVTALHGIAIRTNGVDLDLRGFNIFRSSPAAARGTAIVLDRNSLRNISIANGNITSGVAYNPGAGGDQFTGPGFVSALAEEADLDPANVRVSYLRISGCDLDGIRLNNTALGESNRVEHCAVMEVGRSGIQAGEVHHSSAVTCGGIAINALGNVSFCRAKSIGTGAAGGILAGGNVSASIASSRDGHAISSGANVSDCTGVTESITLTSDGIRATYNVANSSGETAGDDGIESVLGGIFNSYGRSTGLGLGSTGLTAAGSVTNSQALAAVGVGLVARMVDVSSGVTDGTGPSTHGIDAGFSVSDSYGRTAGGAGIHARTVTSSNGTSTGTDFDADGIYALRNVSDSYGKATGGDGIQAGGNISNSEGFTNSPSPDSHGLRTTECIANSFGNCEGAGHGLSCKVASYCTGRTTSAAPDRYALACGIAVGCNNTSGGVAPWTNKHLMP